MCPRLLQLGVSTCQNMHIQVQEYFTSAYTSILHVSQDHVQQRQMKATTCCVFHFRWSHGWFQFLLLFVQKHLPASPVSQLGRGCGLDPLMSGQLPDLEMCERCWCDHWLAGKLRLEAEEESGWGVQGVPGSVEYQLMRFCQCSHSHSPAATMV